jgi:outer membrane cobalamin receptor
MAPGVDARSAVRAATLQAGVQGKLTPGWQTELRFAQGTDTANVITAVTPGAFKTQQDQWTWQNNIDTPLGVVLAGLEHREQRVSGSTAYSVTQRTIEGVFAGLSGRPGQPQLAGQCAARQQFAVWRQQHGLRGLWLPHQPGLACECVAWHQLCGAVVQPAVLPGLWQCRAAA